MKIITFKEQRYVLNKLTAEVIGKTYDVLHRYIDRLSYVKMHTTNEDYPTLSIFLFTTRGPPFINLNVIITSLLGVEKLNFLLKRHTEDAQKSYGKRAQLTDRETVINCFKISEENKRDLKLFRFHWRYSELDHIIKTPPVCWLEVGKNFVSIIKPEDIENARELFDQKYVMCKYANSYGVNFKGKVSVGRHLFKDKRMSHTSITFT
jgi:hypothetical protein